MGAIGGIAAMGTQQFVRGLVTASILRSLSIRSMLVAAVTETSSHRGHRDHRRYRAASTSAAGRALLSQLLIPRWAGPLDASDRS